MKKLLLLIIAIVTTMMLQSQTMKIEIKDITSNSFKIINKSDITYKLRIKSPVNNQTFGNILLKPNFQTGSLSFNINEFNKSFIDRLTLDVYYDYECYIEDLKLMTELKQKMIRDEISRQNTIALLRSVAAFFGETTDENSFAGKLSRGVNKGIEIYDYMKSIGENGLRQTGIDGIKAKLKDEMINYTFTNDQIRGLVKAYDAYTSYDQTVNVDFSELNNVSSYLLTKISTEPQKTYGISYERDIQPVVDYDNDGITNYYDDCPRTYGYAAYGGCTKEYVLAQKRARRKEKLNDIFGYDFHGGGWGKNIIRMGYRNVKFNTASFEENKKNNVIKYLYGADLNLAFIAYPFMLDGGIYTGIFKVDNSQFDYYNNYADIVTEHTGYDIYLNIFPLPKLGGVTHYISPYAGIGYQNSNLTLSDQTFPLPAIGLDEEKIIANYHMSSYMWKVGTFIHITSGISLCGEYRRSVNSKENEAKLAEWIVGLNFAF